MLEKAVNLMAIGCFCIGTDTIDLKFAAGRGIPVFNSPYANSRSVAELVIAEMVLLARQTGDRSMECHKGTWNKQSAGCYEIRGKTLGIIGYGHVGSQLSVLAEAMGMNVLFYDVVPQLSLGNAKQVPLDDLLAQAMFVSLHVPKLPTTANMIAAPQLEKMSKGSYLLNLSRGNVVDVDALAAALKSGHLHGAAVDVYPTEPAGLTHDFVTPLQGCPNTILTPHIGGSTEEAQSGIGLEVSSKLINFINNGNTNGAVNLPHVLPNKALKAGQTRVCCFHKNVPGVMRDLNNILADHNVVYQSLSTDDDTGYMICDIGSTAGKEIKEKLNAVSSTTRNYVLFQGDGYQGEYGE
jgi:D-3-phosphoglycerate dehydrogenase